MSEIRRIVKSDLEDELILGDIKSLAEQFFNESGFPGEFTLGRFLHTWKLIIVAHGGAMFGLFDEGRLVGMIGAVISANIFSTQVLASELFWYVAADKRAHGIKLLRALLSWAMETGIDQLMMGHMHFAVSERVEQLYTRMGFKKLETIYILKV